MVNPINDDLVINSNRIAFTTFRNLHSMLAVRQTAVIVVPSSEWGLHSDSEYIVRELLVTYVRYYCLELVLGMKYQKPEAEVVRIMTSPATTA